MELSEQEFKRYLEASLSHATYFSCVILYERTESLGWYTALSIGEIIKKYFESKIGKEINIHLTLEINKIIPDLAEMGDNDVLLLATDNKIIKIISSHLVSEVIDNKKSIIFISKDDNPLIKRFKGITDVVIQVNSISRGKLNCVIKISNQGERELNLMLPDRSLANNYNELRASLLKEAIKRQVPELEDKK